MVLSNFRILHKRVSKSSARKSDGKNTKMYIHVKSSFNIRFPCDTRITLKHNEYS